jgi:predicted PurR-regulated permease PerM
MASMPLQDRLKRSMPPFMAALLIAVLWAAVLALPALAVVAVLAPVVPQLVAHPPTGPQIVKGLRTVPMFGAWVQAHADPIQIWLARHPVGVLVQDSRAWGVWAVAVGALSLVPVGTGAVIVLASALLVAHGALTRCATSPAVQGGACLGAGVRRRPVAA